MVKGNLSRLLRKWRIMLWIFLVLLSILLIFNIIPINRGKGIGAGNGLDYGLDFEGGIRLYLKLEKEVNAETMQVEREILQNRLNGVGLKDVRIVPLMQKYILIEVVNASAEDLQQIEEILKKQAKFEARINGEVALIGDEIQVDLSSKGSLATPSEPSDWFVAIRNTPSGGERFCQVGGDKKGEPIDMFLDRPEDAVIVLPNSTFNILNEIEDFYGYTYVDVVEQRAKVPFFRLGNESQVDLTQLRKFNKSRILLVSVEEETFSDNFVSRLEEEDYRVEKKIKAPEESYEEWVQRVIGLQSSPKLNCDPCGECKYSAQITGQSPTLEEARREIKKNQVLLSSGNLPAKLEIAKKSEVSPFIGKTFLNYSFLIGIFAIIMVSLIVFFRYRRLFIVSPIVLTASSEIILILGFAALIPAGGKLGWEIDLSAIAGIIAAVGTGVDHQIIITDETMKREKEKKIRSMIERIRRAFFIIFTAAATTIGAMIPIFMVQELRGFAFTTIVGVLIGVLITRPAYGKIVEELLEE